LVAIFATGTGILKIVYNKKITFFTCFLLLCLNGFGQRYNFQQFDIEDGLPQSQVTAITQDQQRRLWVATLGGLSSFNGYQFNNFSKTNGLKSNFVLSLVVNEKNELFIGSDKGLGKYSGKKFYSYNEPKNWVSKLITDDHGGTYWISKGLFRTDGKKTQQLNISNNPNEIVTAVRRDAGGRIWVAIYDKGLYYQENGQWHMQTLDAKIRDLIVTDFLIDNGTPGKIWLLTTTGVFIAENGQVNKAYPEVKNRCNTIIQDEKGYIWLGTNKGAWYITPHQTIHFNSRNGFTDNEVRDIFKDAENNIWLGTEGAGLYKFSNNGYITYDESQGLKNNVVMSMAKGPKAGEVWLGTYDGLFVHKNNIISKILIPSEDEDAKKVNFLFNDSKKRLWMGTVGGGIWMYQNEQFKRIDRNEHPLACNTMLEDSQKRIWLSTNYGCFILNFEKKKLDLITESPAMSLLEIGRDSIIAGTQNGPVLIHNKKVSPLNIKALKGLSVLSMCKIKNHVFFGTADNGLMIWNMTTGDLRVVSSKDGLASDHIYSILLDKKGVIWIGTGRGVNRLSAKYFNVIKNTNGSTLLVECNQNAILESEDNVWIGTTKGAIVFYSNPALAVPRKPYVFINSVSVMSQTKQQGDQHEVQTTYKEQETGQTIVLPYSNNHLSIAFTGIYLTNPDAVRYQYRLIGLDAKFSQPTASAAVNYNSLPAGKYTFEVQAITTVGIASANTASFQFEITPPYYQTTIFRALVVCLILVIIAIVVYTILYLNERQRKLRLKIKLEEQFKIRKQTAEDFHDDLGNKLTRISVLSEVLTSMMGQGETEKKGIIQKIKTNVNELYLGTKDILWSLDPKNDTLNELLHHIEEFGAEMFNETPVEFIAAIAISRDDVLPLEVGRNILMIFKEAIHNALKYARATEVQFSASVSNDTLTLKLKDNGSGFDVESAKHGHGINNMTVRSERIHSRLEIHADENGTTIALYVKFSTLNF
jgi:ligand-binding sensor domain-containing protein/signal transduction histidine kinase